MDQLRRKVIMTGVLGLVALAGTARAQTPVPPSTAPSSQSAAPSPQAVSLAPPPAPPTPKDAPGWAYLVPIAGPAISGILAFVGVAIGLWVGNRNTARTIEAAAKSNQAAIWQKANEAEIQAIGGKLDAFYGPFVQLSGVNRLLAGDLRARLGGGADFRLMMALFEPGWIDRLSKGDAEVVRQICTNAGRLEALLEGKAGAVDEGLAPYLARAATHFRMLRLAGEGQLSGDPAPFERYVYPRQLDGVVEREVARLRRRLEALRARPASPAGPMEALEIPPDLELDPWPGVPRR